MKETKFDVFGVENASEATIQFLIGIGAIYEDETGFHASREGVYKTE